MRQLNTLFFGVLLAVGVWFGAAQVAAAATLYLSPTSGNVTAGDIFTVSIYVTSTDQALNAYSGTLSYPSSIVEVTGLSPSGITEWWVQEPTYSNASGSVSFEGLIPNPGFTGSGGKILTLTFKAKSSGSAPIVFTESSVLANDGQGTNILTGVGNASFTILAEEDPDESPPAEADPGVSPSQPPVTPPSSPGEAPSSDDGQPSEPSEPNETEPPLFDGETEPPSTDLTPLDTPEMEKYFYPLALLILAGMVLVLSYFLLRSTRWRRR